MSIPAAVLLDVRTAFIASVTFYALVLGILRARRRARLGARGRGAASHTFRSPPPRLPIREPAMTLTIIDLLVMISGAGAALLLHLATRAVGLAPRRDRARM